MLTQKDVEQLLVDPSASSRAEVAVKVALGFEQDSFSESERKIAEGIVRALARDAAVRVRQALAENLKNSPSLPADVSVLLARDVEAVALPILESSLALPDTDLIDLVRTGGAARQTAIARRAVVSADVADALIDHGHEVAVAVLMGNAGADLREGSLDRVVDRFGTSELVQTALVHRHSLPVTVSERLVAMVSDQLRDYLVTHHELSPVLASDLVLQSRERATVSLVSGEAAESVDVERLVAQLAENGRLTPSLLLRTLCMGDLGLFEAGMASLAAVPVTNARLLIHDAGKLGLKSIYDKAKLPPGLFPAVKVALAVAQETDFDGEPGDRDRHRRRMIERILSQYEGTGGDDIDYLLSKLGDLVRPAA
jgi:uncharacterized protein (DUF2336 family)